MTPPKTIAKLTEKLCGPDCRSLLSRLSSSLEVGGFVIEHSPWNLKNKKGGWERHSPLHFEEKEPLSKVFSDLGFVSAGEHVWRKKRV